MNLSGASSENISNLNQPNNTCGENKCLASGGMQEEPVIKQEFLLECKEGEDHKSDALELKPDLTPFNGRPSANDQDIITEPRESRNSQCERTAKSRAEIQRAYRERKKVKEGELYSERERTRKRAAYVRTNDLPNGKLLKRRERIRNNMKRRREKETGTNEFKTASKETSDAQTSNTDTGPCDSTTADLPRPRLVMKLSTEKKTQSRKIRPELELRRVEEELRKERVEVQRLTKLLEQRQPKKN